MFSPELKKGSVELMVPSVIEKEPKHGYDIGKLIETRSGGQIQFHITSLYPVLYRMENRGWIRGRWVEKEGQRRRYFYRLTRNGEKVLSEQRENWKEFVVAIGKILDMSHA